MVFSWPLAPTRRRRRRQLLFHFHLFLGFQALAPRQALGRLALRQPRRPLQRLWHARRTVRVEQLVRAKEVRPLELCIVAIAVFEPPRLAHEPGDAPIGIVGQPADIAGKVERLSRPLAKLAEGICVAGLEHPGPKARIAHPTLEKSLITCTRTFDPGVVADAEKMMMVDDVQLALRRDHHRDRGFVDSVAALLLVISLGDRNLLVDLQHSDGKLRRPQVEHPLLFQGSPRSVHRRWR